MISIATFTIGLLPNMWWSFYILIICRMIQGFAFAIEFPTGSAIAVTEDKPHVVVNGATTGYILAPILISLIPLDLDNLWRVPFILGGLAGFGILLSRIGLDKSEIYSRFESVFERSVLLVAVIVGLRGLMSIDISILPKVDFSLFNTSTSQILYFMLTCGSLIVQRFYFPYVRTFITFVSSLYSLKQASIVAANPSLFPIHTLSLVLSIIFAHVFNRLIVRYKILTPWTNIHRIGLVCMLIIVGFGTKYILGLFTDPFIQIMLQFGINQFIITMYIITNSHLIKHIPTHVRYRIPLLYNIGLFVSSLAISIMK